MRNRKAVRRSRRRGRRKTSPLALALPLALVIPAKAEAGGLGLVVGTTVNHRHRDPEDERIGIGLRVAGAFEGVIYRGTVVRRIPPEPEDNNDCGGEDWWRVAYDDGDGEDLTVEELEYARKRATSSASASAAFEPTIGEADNDNGAAMGKGKGKDKEDPPTPTSPAPLSSPVGKVTKSKRPNAGAGLSSREERRGEEEEVVHAESRRRRVVCEGSLVPMSPRKRRRCRRGGSAEGETTATATATTARGARVGKVAETAGHGERKMNPECIICNAHARERCKSVKKKDADVDNNHVDDPSQFLPIRLKPNAQERGRGGRRREGHGRVGPRVLRAPCPPVDVLPPRDRKGRRERQRQRRRRRSRQQRGPTPTLVGGGRREDARPPRPVAVQPRLHVPRLRSVRHDVLGLSRQASAVRLPAPPRVVPTVRRGTDAAVQRRGGRRGPVAHRR